MISLVLDTSTPYLLISIVENNEIRFQYNDKIDRDLSSQFMVILNDAFLKSGINPRQVDKVFVSTGPGSFTGIRIGMTFAKVFCYGFNKDLIPFSTLELLSTSSSNCNVAAIIDAKRNYVYRGVYDKDLNAIVNDDYVPVDKINSEHDIIDKYISYDEFNEFKTEFPKIDVIKLINKHIYDIPVSPYILKPVYLKKTEAEEKLNND